MGHLYLVMSTATESLEQRYVRLSIYALAPWYRASAARSLCPMARTAPSSSVGPQQPTCLGLDCRRGSESGPTRRVRGGVSRCARDLSARVLLAQGIVDKRSRAPDLEARELQRAAVKGGFAGAAAQAGSRRRSAKLSLATQAEALGLALALR